MKIIRLLVPLVLCAVILLQPVSAFGVQNSAGSAILIEAESGRVLYEKNPDEERLIASTTKIMTAIVAIENADLDKTITVKAALAATEGSSMYLKAGEQITLETLLYGLLLCSGNDAAMVIADAVGGGVGGFVAMMNNKAAELSLAHTSFANPSGLDHEKQYSSAADMAKLTAYAMKNTIFSRIVSTRSISIGGRTMTNHNKLLSMYAGCIGVKTGYTKAAGRTLVSCASKNGMTLIAVTLNDGCDWDDHMALYDYGFGTYQNTDVLKNGDEVGRLRVNGGTLSTVSLVANRGFYYPVAQGEHISQVFDLPASVDAPVSRGDVVGTVVYYLGEKNIGSTEIICKTDITIEKKTTETNKSGLLGIFRQFLRF